MSREKEIKNLTSDVEGLIAKHSISSEELDKKIVEKFEKYNNQASDAHKASYDTSLLDEEKDKKRKRKI